MSETKRGLIRIASNYARLFSTLILGLFWVPLLLRCVEDEAFGLVAFLGTNAGMADRIRDIINRSMVRELGIAYHSEEPKNFLRTFNCALAVCLCAAALTILLHLVLMAFLPLFPVSETLLFAGCCFIAAKGIESSIAVILAPVFNIYMIDERMPTYNFLLVAIRSANILAAGTVIFLFPLSELSSAADISRNVIVYGFLSAGLSTAVLVLSVLNLVIRDKRLRPRFSLVNWKGIKSIVATGGWNTGIVFSTGSFVPIAGLYMYGLLGSLGGRVFGIAMPLTYYVRILATGMATGLDAVSVRVSSGKSDISLKQLVQNSARLNGFVIFPSILFICIFAEVIVQIWVGQNLDSVQDIQMIASVVRAMALGSVAMGIADAWIPTMYGAGHINKIAPMVLLGLFVYAVLMPFAIWLAPESWEYLAPALFSSLAITVFMLFGIAIAVSRILKMSLPQTLMPLGRPLSAALAALPVLLPYLLWVDHWTLAKLIAAMLSYSVLYIVLSWYVTFHRDERERTIRMLGAQWKKITAS